MIDSHTHNILGLTIGHPATWNDKILILFDQLLCNVHNGIIQDEIGFILYERNKYGNITEA